MPALVAFRRRWKIGSDDLVLPGLAETIVRFIWFVALVVVWICDAPSMNSEEGFLIQIYFAVACVIMAITMVQTVVLVLNSRKGSIMDVAKRKHVPLLIYIRVMLAVPELAWNMVGTIWVFTFQDENLGSSKNAIKGFVICYWILLGFVVFGIIMVFEPGSRGSLIVSDLEKKRSKTWERRCKILCCSCCSGSGSKGSAKKETFREIADLFVSVFNDVDIVPSDIAAGLFLLNLRYKLKRKEMQHRCSLVSPRPGSEKPVSSIEEFPHFPSVIVECGDGRRHWMNPELAYHYFKYARGTYGWMLQLYSGFGAGIQNLARDITCCSCFRKVASYEAIDNCCRSNLAAMKRMTLLTDDDIVYVSFHNKLFEVPFYVATDHQTSAIVIAIRGTLSFHDALTDLTAHAEAVNADGLPEGFLAHKGILNAATFVLKQLDEKKVLEQALQRFPGYRIVVVGHSLGAGTAALLSILLKTRYSDIRCFAYSPPGGLVNEAAADFTESFCLSVVTGDDLVPRLSLTNVGLLKQRLSEEIQACPYPKYRILLRGCWSIIFRKSAVTTLPYQFPRYNHVEVSLSERNSPTETLQCLPGRIMNITQRRWNNTSLDEWHSVYDWSWKDRRDFAEVLVTRNMLIHHFPNYVEKALCCLTQQSQNETEA